MPKKSDYFRFFTDLSSGNAQTIVSVVTRELVDKTFAAVKDSILTSYGETYASDFCDLARIFMAIKPPINHPEEIPEKLIMFREFTNTLVNSYLRSPAFRDLRAIEAQQDKQIITRALFAIATASILPRFSVEGSVLAEGARRKDLDTVSKEVANHAIRGFSRNYIYSISKQPSDLTTWFNCDESLEVIKPDRRTQPTGKVKHHVAMVAPEGEFEDTNQMDIGTCEAVDDMYEDGILDGQVAYVRTAQQRGKGSYRGRGSRGRGRANYSNNYQASFHNKSTQSNHKAGKNLTCLLCYRPGHSYTTCRMNLGRAPPGICFICHGSGHGYNDHFLCIDSPGALVLEEP